MLNFRSYQKQEAVRQKSMFIFVQNKNAIIKNRKEIYKMMIKNKTIKKNKKKKRLSKRKKRTNKMHFLYYNRIKKVEKLSKTIKPSLYSSMKALKRF